jgi:predicted N-acetyltransferase YhbS
VSKEVITSEPREPDDSVRVRKETPGSAEDRAAIHTVNEAAFVGSGESTLVDKLRADGHAILSLVAELDASRGIHGDGTQRRRA